MPEVKHRVKYIYQKFLLNCEYEEIALEKIPSFDGNLSHILPHEIEYSVLDYGKSVIRKIPLSDIDFIIDTEEDWDKFIESIHDAEKLIIVDEMRLPDNDILQDYREATLKAYIYRLQKAGIEVYVNNVFN